MHKQTKVVEQEIITIVVVDDIPETREKILQMVQFEPDMKIIGLAATGRESVAMVKELRPNIVIMDINMPDMDGFQATALITQAVPTAAVIMMSVQSDQDYLQRAMLVGARFFLSKPVSMDDLYNTIRSVYAQHKSLASQYNKLLNSISSTGHTIVIYSAEGGAGCTTIAVNLAVNLVKKHNRVLLVDADLQFGDIGVFLNLHNESTIVDLAQNINNLEGKLLKQSIITHDTGLEVLIGPLTPAQAVIVQQYPEAVANILTQLSPQYDFIIVDTGRHLNETLGAIFDIADKILLLATPILTGIKNSRLVLNEFSALGYSREKTWIILNKCDHEERNLYTINSKKINNFLKTEIQLEIPYNRNEVLKSIAKGQPFIINNNASKIPIATEISKLADNLIKAFPKKDSNQPVSEENSSIPNDLEIESLRQKHHIVNEKLLLAQANFLLVHVIEQMYKIAFSAAHDMRSPLGIAIDTVDARINKNQGSIELLDIANELQACLHEVNTFLNISLFEEGGTDTENAIELFRQMANTLKSIGSIEIAIDPKQILLLQVRRTQLQLLFYNLLMIVLNWPSTKDLPTVSLKNKALVFKIIQKEPQSFNMYRAGKLGARSKFDATGTRFYVIDRILRHVGGKFVVETTEEEVLITVYPPPTNWKSRSSSLALAEIKKEISQFQIKIDEGLAKELTKGQQLQVDQTYIDIVSGFYREMSKHFHRAKTKLATLNLTSQDTVINKVSRNIQYCELLIRNVVLTATGTENYHQEVNLYEAILDTTALIERKAIPARIELIIDVMPKELIIETDKLALQQVLMNLGRNAIDAIKHDGCIMFHAHMIDNQVYIDVIDTGPGIPEELQNRIFQLGFSTKTGGYGIGLHSVKAIIEELNGKIDFQTLMGLGTIMHIELPLGNSND